MTSKLKRERASARKAFFREAANEADSAASQQIASPGDPAQYIEPFEIKPGERVFLACPSSTRAQKDNPEDQETKLRPLVEAEGGIVVGACCLVTSAKDPIWVRDLVRQAREAGADLILAESTCRLIRHEDYNSKTSPLEPLESDLRKLNKVAGDFRLMTYLDPNATLEEVKEYQIKRGQSAKGNKGGRPRKEAAPVPGAKKELREKYRPMALELYKQDSKNWNPRKMAEEISRLSGRRVTDSTVWDWVNFDYKIDKSRR